MSGNSDRSEVPERRDIAESSRTGELRGRQNGTTQVENSDITEEAEHHGSAENPETQPDKLLSRMDVHISDAPEDPLEGKTMFRVPAFVRHKDLFVPKMVSIGPYHCHKKSLRSMKEHKWSFLKSFLNSGKTSLDKYISDMRKIENQARKCYSKVNNNSQGDNDFVMMLILDGCFILEHLLKLESKDVDKINRAYCNSGWFYGTVTTDLALIENQIPFFVLHQLYETHNGGPINCSRDSCSLRKLIIKHSVHSSFKKHHPKVACEGIKHYLHLIYLCMTSKYEGNENTDTQNTSDNERENNVIPCASELYEAGVTFKCKEERRHMFEVTFRNGIMEIPSLKIDCDIKIIFANIVAFEQTQVMSLYPEPPAVMSYLSLMDALVNTKRDVDLLVKKGILQNMMQDEENVAAFFNDLGEFFVPVKYKKHEVYPHIQKYRAKRLPTIRAQLKHDYFRNALSTFSVIVAGVLLLATILQTIFTGMQTFLKPV